MLPDTLVPRRARRELEETLQVLRVAVLNGPRQAGKTTLAKQLVAAAGGSSAPSSPRTANRWPSTSSSWAGMCAQVGQEPHR